MPADVGEGTGDVADGMTSIDLPAGAAYNEVMAEPGLYEAALPEAAPDVVPDVVAAPRVLPVVDVEQLDWAAVRNSVDPAGVHGRLRDTVERMEALLDQEPRRLLFDDYRADTSDRVIRVREIDPDTPLWIVGDLHGDLLALEAALAFIHRDVSEGNPPRLVFLGDLFDDGGYGLEVLLRVCELIAETPESVCIIAGNHDEALRYTGSRFSSSVIPSDFSDFLNAYRGHEWITRAGILAVRLFAGAPRALFLPDGLLVTHGGFPIADLHAQLRTTGDWNDPRCLSDFVWTRAHPRARKKMPNRASRGSQFGYEDFAAFCALTAELGRPITRMVRGHDHPDERFEIYPAYADHPVLTTVALSRRLEREPFGPFERVPTIARWVFGALPQVHRLHVPAALVREVYADEAGEAEPEVSHTPRQQRDREADT